MKKNLFFTFCFSFIPGAGQMYQTYMKRGLSFMILFGISIALMAIIGSPIFAIPIPIILAYSFFDTYNIRQKLTDGIKEDDCFLFKGNEIEKILGKVDNYKKNSFVGWILIIVGVYLLLNSVLMPILYRFELYFIYETLRLIMNYVPSIVIAAISISVGVKFISKD